MGHDDTGAPTPFSAPAAGALAVYRGATLLDGTGGPARPATTIVVAGQTIRTVGPDAEVPDVPGAEVFELGGRFVVPGLIDSHQHLATPPNRALAESVLRRHVYSGVTAIRDMADDLRQVGDLARATRVGEIPGPDIHYAALMAGPDFFDDPRTWQVSQGEIPGTVPWMQAVTEQTDLSLAVALARGTHATAIKVYADLPGSLVAAIAAEARRQGIQVWAHGAVFPAGPGEVVAAGVDAVSHVTLLVHEAAEQPLTSYKDKPPIDYARFAEGGDDARLGALFQSMLEHGTVLDATACMWVWMEEQAEDDAGRARARLQDGLSARLTAQAYRAGVPISTGTDYETEPEHPYPALFDELTYLVRRCGIPAEQVIRSATLVGAMSMGAEAAMGTVESGKLANFAVLARDPLADIDNLRSIECTVKRGRRFERADYQAEHDAKGRSEG
ncbi:amidohydrolase family protein [Streptacidiphilus cavernicola]|uniref:Amidohydrolase family protein n=1 Tax=Streptacidiphilus cavernicola TaxID=3342716 RepID=A0ABV6VWI6_9ACTN